MSPRAQKKPGVSPRAATLIIRALQMIATDESPTISPGESYSGVANLRYEAVTNGIRWMVDIYGKGYCRAQVGSSLSEICRTTPSLIRYISRKLGDH